MDKLTCPHCGGIFETEVKTKKYCTKECKETAKAIRYAKRKEAKTSFCEHCSGPKGSAKGKYCSQVECRRLSRRESEERVSDEAREKRRKAINERRKANPRKGTSRPHIQGPKPACRRCGAVLSALHGRYCSARECRNALASENRRLRPDVVRSYRQARKARERDAFEEFVDIELLKQRDNWTCGICRKKIRKNSVYPDPKSPSVDHITPISLGGKHSYANTQLACLDCNIRKGAHGFGDQLALI